MNPIAFSPPHICEEDIQAVVRVLRSGWITSGSVGEEFAHRLCAYTGARSAVMLNSATAGLFLALKAFGIGQGDEVVTTPYTFAATANAIVHTGAKVVFADVEPSSFFISPQNIVQKITPKTKAVIPVDFGGGLCAYEAIHRALADHTAFRPSNPFQEALNRPLLLSDSAHSLGAYCTLPDIRVYSFHAVKNITTAEGGALALHRMGGEELSFHRQVQLLALHGQDKNARDKFLGGGWEYDISTAGYKFNMPDVLAALGLSQLQRYEGSILPQRQRLFQAYEEAFSEGPFLLPNLGVGHSAHLFPLRIEGLSLEGRGRLIQKLKEKHIASNVHYKPLTLMKAAPLYGREACPEAESLWENEISLPIHGGLSFSDIAYIAEEVKKYSKIHRRKNAPSH